MRYLVRSLTSRPLLATAIAMLGFWLWLRSLDGTCGDVGGGGIRMPWVLVVAAAVGEARAAARRGGEMLSVVLWGLMPPERRRGDVSSSLRVKSGRQDLNLRPPGPQPGALPDCATPRGAWPV